MGRYNVVVSRSFAVEIDAENSVVASRLVETFLGFKDEATETEQKENNFKIHSIEMLENDVIEIESVN
jgi:pantothenate kinase